MKKHKLIYGQKILYKVKDLEKENLNLYGYYDTNEKTIFINKKLKVDDLKSTILHEEIHAIFDRIGLNQTAHTSDFQEIICESISKFICENYIIKDR